MNTNSAIKTLEDCERGLRKAAGDALACGDYDTARQIMAWAENVVAMTAVARSQHIDANTQPVLPSIPVAVPPRAVGKARGGGDEYPRFMRRNDELVKIGWSKQERKEYNHRAPRRALDAVVTTLKRIASDGSGFSSENLSLLKDPEGGGVFPLYQVFVVLAWLRKLGLVKQHGRKSGYSLITERPIDAIIANAWPALPTLRG